MTDLSKIYIVEEVLDLSVSGTYTTTFPCDLVKATITGCDVATGPLVLTVNAVQVASQALVAGAGEVDSTSITSAANVGTPTPYTAQAAVGTAQLGYVKQANATTEGQGNYIGPVAPGQTPISDNIATGINIVASVAAATAGTVTLYLDKSGAEAAATNLGAVGNGSSY